MTTINHHPTEETLEAYVRGKLDEGRRVLVAAHAELCASCARMLSATDHIAGTRLAAIEPTPLEDDALSRALARIDRVGRGEARSYSPPSGDRPFDLQALAGYERGPWRWMGPGVHWRSVAVPVGEGARVFMLRAAPGTSLPHHTHTGTELTLILQGAFVHEGGRFGVGDFDDADGTIEHQPVVEPGDACICLVAMQGQLRLLGPLGRIMQPFVRM